MVDVRKETRWCRKSETRPKIIIKRREREAVRHIKMDQAPTEVEERVIEWMESEEVWKRSHDEMDSTGP